MDCKKVSRLIDAYAADELTGDRAGEVAAHLERCADCRKALEEYRMLSLVIRGSVPPAPEADASFFRRLNKRLDRVDRRMGRVQEPLIRWRVVGTAAAAAATVLVVFTYFNPFTPKTIVVPAARVAQGPRQDSQQAPTYYVRSYPLPYLSVSNRLSSRSAPVENPYGLLIPRVYFPQRTWPIGGTKPFETQSITKADYERLQKKVQDLETRLVALERKSN